MTDEHLRNPAGRLFLLLEYSSGSDRTTVARHWGSYYGLDPFEWPAYYRVLVDVLGLPRKIRDEVEALVNPALPVLKLLAPVDHVEPILLKFAAGTAQVREMNNEVGAVARASLETCSYILNGSTDESLVAKEKLDEIVELAGRLKALAMSDSDLDPLFRASILRFASAMAGAAGAYKVGGTAALADELDRLMGYLFRNPGAVPKKANRTWNKVKQLLSVVAGVVMLARAPLELTDAAAFYMSAIPALEGIVIAPGSAEVDMID